MAVFNYKITHLPVVPNNMHWLAAVQNCLRSYLEAKEYQQRQYPFYFNMYSRASVILAILFNSFSYGQLSSPTIKLPAGVQIAAIIPTEPGQIGINPVDIPAASDM